MVATPNGPEGYHTIFKDLGGLIDVHDTIANSSSGVKIKIVNFVENADYDYDTVSVMPTLLSNVVTAVTAQVNGASNVRSSINTYITSVLGFDITSTSTTVSGVLTDLKTQMAADTDNADGLNFYESGVYNRYLKLYASVNMAVQPSGTYAELSLAEANSLKTGSKPATGRMIPDSLGTIVVP